MEKLLKHVISFILSLFLIFVVSQRQSYASVIFEDDFSQGLEKWEVKRGEANLWQVIDGKARALITSGSVIAEMVPKDIYWANNDSITYEFDYLPVHGVDKNFGFNFVDENNWYEFHYSSLLELLKAKNGVGEFSKLIGSELINNTSYRVKISIDKDEISLWVDDVLVTSEKNELFLDGKGKISLKAGTGSVYPTEVFFDNIKVSTIEPPVETKELAVPYFSQRKPWGNEEYNQASQYSWANPPTIERWGCALASMSMVLQFHGIANLPDGQPLNPSTLNTWLKSQPDGYLAEANLNWNAVTRLTRLIAESNQAATPLLEYQWQPQNDEFLKAEIKNDHPVILKTDTHFVTARGYAGDIFSIHDSYWPMKYTLAEYNNTYQNMRVFTPTSSDLSYLIFVTPVGNSLSLKNAVDDTQVSIISYQEGGVADPSDATHLQPTRKVTQLAKPESGQYIVELNGEPVASSSATVYVYDKTGNVQIFSMSKEKNEPVEFELKYQKEGVSTFTLVEEEVEVPHDFDTFSKLVKSYWQQREIKKQYVAVYLLTLSQLSQKLKTRQAKFFMTELIESVLTHLSKKEISPTAKTGLLEEIRQVQTKYSK